MIIKFGQALIGILLAFLYVAAYFESVNGSAITPVLCLLILVLRKISLRLIRDRRLLLTSMLSWGWPFLFLINSFFAANYLYIHGQSYISAALAIVSSTLTVFSLYILQRSSKSKVGKSLPSVHFGFQNTSTYVKQLEGLFIDRPKQVVTNLELLILLAPILASLELTLLPVANGLLLGAAIVAGSYILVGFSWQARPALNRRVQSAIVSGIVKEYKPDLYFYYFGGASSLYQVISWLPALNTSNFRVMIVLRQSGLISKLREHTSFPIVEIPKFTDLGLVADGTSAQGAIYANNSIHNGHFTRFSQLKHILLLHGESDKASSSNGFSKIYDKLYVAGEAAIDRYKNNNIYIPRSSFEIIGRPQIDDILRASESDVEGAIEILYAPTFEGYHSDASYSSVLLFGCEIIETLLKVQGVTIRFRPHPLTGSVSKEYMQALKELLGRFSGDSKFLYDPGFGRSIIEDFNSSSALITDVSSVSVDYLASEKPLIVTNPEKMELHKFFEQFPTAKGAEIYCGDSSRLEKVVELIVQGRFYQKELRSTKKYVLGEFSGNSTSKFYSTLEQDLFLERSHSKDTSTASELSHLEPVSA